MSKRLTTYDITGRMVLVVQISVKADSHEDALEQSKALQEADFVKFQGEFMDGSLKILSIGKSGYWNTDQD